MMDLFGEFFGNFGAEGGAGHGEGEKVAPPIPPVGTHETDERDDSTIAAKTNGVREDILWTSTVEVAVS